MDMQAFYRGESFDAHEYFGAHLDSAPGPDGTRGATFRTFAPAAAGVTLLLERGCAWSDGMSDADAGEKSAGASDAGSEAASAGPAPREVPMARAYDGNVWEARVDDVRPGDPYEFRVHLPGGGYQDHADPFAFGSDLRPHHRSIVRDLSSWRFGDAAWMEQRTACLDKPLNIYELHAGSWRKPRNDEGEERPDLWYRYDELAEPLIAHCKEGGFTHVEFLPLTEHPADESWGYQPSGFFSPTSRWGTPEELMQLIDRLHQAGIGAILDFVPVHFACDAWGMARYDGTALFEYPNQDVGLSEWGSMNFMHSRGEVRSLLQSAANLWLGTYHFDGLRMDAISRIIYWQGDERRGVNGNAVSFIRTMNEGLHRLNPGCLLAAEDSTNYPGVTRPGSQGGLGFDYKWDMGWMHDTLSLFQMPPDERRANYHKLTFSMMYYANEHYLLPFSHDEVVHGKATVLQKMNGGYEGKFPQGRALYLYMAAHPGKKLNFMGSELGQLREWDEKREQDWLLLGYPVHDAFWRYMRALGQTYVAHPALWERDYREDGFAWLDCHEEQRLIYAFERRGGDERLACVLNLDSVAQHYRVALPGLSAEKSGAAGGGDARTDATQGETRRAASAGGGPAAPASAAVRKPVRRAVGTLVYTDWQPFGGSTPEADNPCVLEDDKLVCRLAPFSGVLVKIP